MPAAATTHNENNKVEADHGRQENEWGLRLGGWGGKAELGVTNTVIKLKKKIRTTLSKPIPLINTV